MEEIHRGVRKRETLSSSLKHLFKTRPEGLWVGGVKFLHSWKESASGESDPSFPQFGRSRGLFGEEGVEDGGSHMKAQNA